MGHMAAVGTVKRESFLQGEQGLSEGREKRDNSNEIVKDDGFSWDDVGRENNAIVVLYDAHWPLWQGQRRAAWFGGLGRSTKTTSVWGLKDEGGPVAGRDG